jgi:predicted metal-dependent hydrolase
MSVMEKVTPLPPALEESVPTELFRTEVAAWAERIGVRPVSITVRAMSRKWGSCSSAGRLTFDRDLLLRPASFRAEVIVHELVHLKYPRRRHGKAFRTVVKAYLATYGVTATRGGDHDDRPTGVLCERAP